MRSRFPALVLDERITYVQLEEPLQQAGFPLRYDTASKLFRPPAPELSSLVTSSSTSASGHGGRATGWDPRDVLAGKLTRAVEYGGFVALTLRGVHLPGTAEALAAPYPVRPVNVDGEFLSAFRVLVAEHGHDWEKVHKLDARFSETGIVKPGLASFVSKAWQRVRERLLEPDGTERTVLFLHHASLLARYYDQGGHEFLTGLQQSARRPHEAPHGMWLLCPGDSARDAPRLRNRTVEVLTETERVVLTGEFLAGLREGAGHVA